MEQLRNFGDERQLAWCVYCGGSTGTRDHVPSKVFLDKPYPSNLPVVPSCQSCNQAFSLDEEYLACLIECAVIGSARLDDLQREKVKRILQRKPALALRVSHAREQTGNGIFWRVEAGRVRNVILKLARAHAAFELNEPQYDEPSTVAIVPLHCMTAEDRERFESASSLPLWPEIAGWPEVGSRAMQRIVIAKPGASGWVLAQEGRYRYLAAISEGTVIRMVLSEYLGCEVIWD